MGTHCIVHANDFALAANENGSFAYSISNSSPLQAGHPGVSVETGILFFTFRFNQMSAHSSCAPCLHGSLTCVPAFSGRRHNEHESLRPLAMITGVTLVPSVACWIMSLGDLADCAVPGEAEVVVVDGVLVE